MADGPERLALTVRVASAELWLGRYEQARRHLHVALGELPAQPSADRVRLRMLLGPTELLSAISWRREVRPAKLALTPARWVIK